MDATDPVDPLDPDAVTDRDSFFAFVDALIEDREASEAEERETPSNPYGPRARGWENVTIEAFLDAALRWAESTNMGERQGGAPAPSWQAFASFLYCGKIYE